MKHADIDRLRSIKTFPSLVKYLRDDLGWPINSENFEDLTFDRLKAKGIKPSYESPLTMSGVTKWPDFTIIDDASGETFYWEHLGMLNDPAYARRWDSKLNWYKENKILPAEEGGGEKGTLILTQDSPEGGISSLKIDGLIDKLLSP